MSAKQIRRLATSEEMQDALRDYNSRQLHPQPLDKPSGIVQHFATEEDRRAHLEWLKQHEDELPF